MLEPRTEAEWHLTIIEVLFVLWTVAYVLSTIAAVVQP